MAESSTGIILTTDGARNTGGKNVFKIFDSRALAEEFCKKRINESKDHEYLLFDWKRKKIEYFDPYVLRKN
jgi:hypothetical protein